MKRLGVLEAVCLYSLQEAFNSSARKKNQEQETAWAKLGPTYARHRNKRLHTTVAVINSLIINDPNIGFHVCFHRIGHIPALTHIGSVSQRRLKSGCRDVGGPGRACTKCDMSRTATIFFLGGMNDCSTSEVLLQCVDFIDQGVIRASHMDWVLTAFL